MTQNNYPKTNCPLTGKLCAKMKTLKITELKDGNSSSFGCCQECSETWAEQYSKSNSTPLPEPEKLSLGTLPDAIKEIADLIFAKSTPKTLPKITVSHDLTITPKLLQEAAMRVAKRKDAEVVCPGCDTTLEDMSKKDRFGCAECYSTFAKYVYPLLEKYHGSTEHKGKVPENWEEREMKKHFPADEIIKFKIASLHDEKKDAISEERYERAGEIVEELEQLQIDLLDLNEASLKNECPSSEDSQIDQLPQQKDEDQ